jgi:predicted MPP superfamily phosphohydrolase
MKINKTTNLPDTLWDLWCITSVIGIWPRFIEPNSLSITSLKLPIPQLPHQLKGLKVLQFSDLHLNEKTTDFFLKKLLNKIKKLQPDILFFTGDFLCYSKFPDKERLKDFFDALPTARYGNYAILGNHDYSQFVSTNEEGEYDVQDSQATKPLITRGLNRLFRATNLKGTVSDRAKKLDFNHELIDFLNNTSFKLLHNETVQIPIGGSFLNVCGLGEYMAGKTAPKEAYKNYNTEYPGIILLHNPDGIPLLKEFPGDLVLCGHTHGGQICLPWIANKFIMIENPQFNRGLVKESNRWIYTTRGVGSVMSFRWFCTPEIVLIELESE